MASLMSDLVMNTDTNIGTSDHRSKTTTTSVDNDEAEGNAANTAIGTTSDDRGKTTTGIEKNDEEGKAAGEISGEYPCIYDGVNGTLYAGSEALYFLGRYFLFQKNVFIKWADIRNVQKSDRVGVIIVESNDNDELCEHVFSGIANSDRVWSVLISLHNQSLIDTPKMERGSSLRDVTTKLERSASVRGGALATKRPSIVRMNSDPLATMHPDNLSTPLNDIDENHSLRQTEDEQQKQKQQEQEQEEAQQDSIAAEDARSVTTERSADISTTGDYQVDSVVGKIDGRFPCQYGNYTGCLFAGVVAISFIGQGFLFIPKKIIIEWKDVKQFRVTSNNAGIEILLKPESINTDNNNAAATTRPLVYVFSMADPHRVWESLDDVHKKFLLEYEPPVKETTRPAAVAHAKRRRHTRRNSDPLATSGSVNYVDNTSGEVEVALKPSDEGEGGEPENPKETNGNVNGSSDSSNNQQLPKQSNSTKSRPELKKSWSSLVNEKSSGAVTTVKDVEIPCNLDTFFELFLADDAKYSLSAYMTEKGDTDMQASSWHPVVPNDDESAQTREVHYNHPVNAPMAPPMARARKAQKYNRYGDHGICVKTQTYVEDVPMTDCFYVSDRLLVQPKSNDASSVLITMEYEFIFVKSTMFRGVITRTGSSELNIFLGGMAKYISRSLRETSTTSDVEEEVVVEEETMENDKQGVNKSRRRRSSMDVSRRESIIEISMEKSRMFVEGIDLMEMTTSAATAIGNNLMPLLMMFLVFLQICVLMEMRTLVKTTSLLLETQVKQCQSLE